MKKCYCTHWVMTHPKFIAQILQHGGILNIDISYSLGFCFFGKTFHLERLCLKVKQSVVYDWNRKVCLDVWSQLPVSHTCHYSQAARTLAAPRVHLLPSPFFLWGQGRLRSNHQTLHRHRNYYRHSSSFQKKIKAHGSTLWINLRPWAAKLTRNGSAIHHNKRCNLNTVQIHFL